MKCSICGNEIPVDKKTGYDRGHSSEPINKGRCCNECNRTTVIPIRLRKMKKR